MTFCEVIIDFDPKDFDVIRKNIPLDDIIFFTDNMIVQSTIQQSGYTIHHMKIFFGHANPEIYEINNQAISRMLSIKEYLGDIRYKRVSIVDGLKSYILERLVFLEKIRTILSGRKNVIFLFSSLGYFHFCIPQIAKELRYETKFGVSKVSKSDIVPINFDQTFTVNFRSLYDGTNNNSTQNNTEFIPELSIEFEEDDPQVAFFLINNEEDFYLKPIYPILDEFRKSNTSHLVITFASRTANQLQKKGIKSYDLTNYCNQLEREMIQKNAHIIASFFRKVSSFAGDKVLLSYFKYFQNDRIAIDIARELAVIAITSFIFERFALKSILVATDGIMETYVACNTAKNYTVSSYSIPSGMTELNPIYGILNDASQLLLSGPRLKKDLIELGVRENRLIITGMPRYDYVKQNNSNSDYNTSEKQKKNLVIIAMSRLHENDDNWMSELIHFCNKIDLEVLIKLHPLYEFNPDHREICRQKMDKIKERCNGLKYDVTYDADLSKLFSRTAILITEYSLVGVEASLNEIPIISVNMDNETYYDFSLEFSKEGVALYATNTSELFDCINKVLHDDIVIKKLDEGRKGFNLEFNYLNDGNSSKRIFNILTEND